jgi:aconitate hydratase
VSQLAADVARNNYPAKLSAALIGSCTNSSYEDIGRAAFIAREARKQGLKARVPLLVSPGSEQVRATIERDGLLADLEAIGASVLANACGPCIGQWERSDVPKGEANSIITSFNRNFKGRNDGNPGTHAFIGSPETVIAYALAGRLDTNPMKDGVTADGRTVALTPPAADELPARGYVAGESGYVAPAANSGRLKVAVSPRSERLALLEPFEPVDKMTGYAGLPVLLKARGKCTTDNISPAGPWLKFRGHLDRISDNMFSTAVNSFSDKPGIGFNVLTGAEQPLNELARAYKARGLGWVAVGDTNYGEGSSREHAAMSPRFLGCRAVLVKSFARIHETNLKKQGILPLTFANPADYDRLRKEDRLTLEGVAGLAPGRPVRITVAHADGTSETIEARHSLTRDQLGWFEAGSALNLIRKAAPRAKAAARSKSARKTVRKSAKSRARFKVAPRAKTRSRARPKAGRKRKGR